MVAALSTVYVPEEHASFLRRHTLEGNAIWALSVQVSLEDVVGFRLSSDSLCLRIFLGEDSF